MAASTSRRMSALTRGEPLTTRETVALDTPAREATSSRVVPFRPRAGAFATDPVPPCESALTCGLHCIRPCQESALTKVDARRTVSLRPGTRHPGQLRLVGARPAGRRPWLRGPMRHFAHGRDRGIPRPRCPSATRPSSASRCTASCGRRPKMFCGVFDRLRRRATEHARLPGLPRLAGRPAGHQPARGRARPRHRARDRGDRSAGHALGPQELLLPGPAQGLPDQPVRPAARVAGSPDLRDLRRTRSPSRSRAPTSRRTPPSSSIRTAGRPAGAASSTSTAPARRSWRSSPSPRSGPPSRRDAMRRSCNCCCARSAPPTPTWSAARCASRRTCRSGASARSRSGRGSRSRT